VSSSCLHRKGHPVTKILQQEPQQSKLGKICPKVAYGQPHQPLSKGWWGILPECRMEALFLWWMVDAMSCREAGMEVILPGSFPHAVLDLCRYWGELNPGGLTDSLTSLYHWAAADSCYWVNHCMQNCGCVFSWWQRWSLPRLCMVLLKMEKIHRYFLTARSATIVSVCVCVC